MFVMNNQLRLQMIYKPFLEKHFHSLEAMGCKDKSLNQSSARAYRYISNNAYNNQLNHLQAMQNKDTSLVRLREIFITWSIGEI